MDALRSLYFQRLDAPMADFAEQFYLHPGPNRGGSGTSRGFFGFLYRSQLGYPMIASVRTGAPVELTRVWSVPYWAPAAVTALPSAALLAAITGRLRRLRRGVCTACGYDLRATLKRCPECGTRTAT